MPVVRLYAQKVRYDPGEPPRLVRVVPEPRAGLKPNASVRQVGVGYRPGQNGNEQLTLRQERFRVE